MIDLPLPWTLWTLCSKHSSLDFVFGRGLNIKSNPLNFTKYSTAQNSIDCSPVVVDSFLFRVLVWKLFRFNA